MSNYIETARFQEFPKMSRLSREASISEKIDGTNAAVNIVPLWGQEWDDCVKVVKVVNDHAVIAQSRTKIITPDQDNFGFARWVEANAESLIEELGAGLHFGEWWGSGIQRNYGLKEKRFSLFNTRVWEGRNFNTPGLGVVPVIKRGIFSSELIDQAMAELKGGSFAAPGFTDPEGVVIFHTQSQVLFKKTFEGDDTGKSFGA